MSHAPPSSATGHPVADPVRVLVDDDVVLERPVALGTREVPQEHPHLSGLTAEYNVHQLPRTTMGRPSNGAHSGGVVKSAMEHSN